MGWVLILMILLFIYQHNLAKATIGATRRQLINRVEKSTVPNS